MRKVMYAIAVLLSGISLSSCSTAYRYEYYDYKGKTIDEKNNNRMDKINKKLQGLMSSMGPLDGNGEGQRGVSAWGVGRGAWGVTAIG